jgi:uncharacterized phage protein gp47/JayE
MVAPAERAFPFFPRGEVRATILETWRYHLRRSTNPETGEPFAEAEIQAATAQLSRYWDEADGIDLVCLAIQQRGLWLADQAHPKTASDEWLVNHWGGLWAKTPLPASPGGGTVRALATPGTIFIGSTTRPSPSAHKFRIGTVTYQVMYTSSPVPAAGYIDLVVRSLETGTETNAVVGSRAVWTSGPAGATPDGITLLADFRGGFPAEAMADFAERVESAIRNHESAGNQADFRAWAREASTSVDDAWVYACALEAGSVVVAVAQKRGDETGPLACIPSAGTLLDVTAYLVPPGSPAVPAPPFVLVVPIVSVESDVVVALQMPRASSSGWVDLNPWPANTTQHARVTTVTTQLAWRIDIGDASTLPSATPALMVWDTSRSVFERLSVSSVTLVSGTTYDVVLTQAPETTIAVGLAISPAAARHTTIAQAAEDYFDGLGPGEVVDLSTSTLAADAYRWPPPDEEWPQRVGSGILTFIRDALGAASTDEDLVYVSVSSPALPASVSDGPNRLTLGDFAVYPL